jgi:uncharacterized caspase-like protein
MLATAMVAALLYSALAAPDRKPRFALLIGNQKYPAVVGPLKNPRNDIAVIKAAFLKAGFHDKDIQVISDADRVTMLNAFDEFATKVGKAGLGAVSFFYYSGHGAANEPRDNYLIPVDVPQLTVRGFWNRSVSLRTLVERLKEDAPQAKHFIIFDACRNELKLIEPETRTLIQPKGFAPYRDIPGGVLIAYATAEGELASDHGTDAGPYASALAEEIVKPGVEAFTVFRNVQIRLIETVQQQPWMNSGPMGPFYFAELPEDEPLPSASASEAARLRPPSGPVVAAREVPFEVPVPSISGELGMISEPLTVSSTCSRLFQHHFR